MRSKNGQARGKEITQKTVPKMKYVQNWPYGPEGNLDCGHKNCNFA